MQRNANEQQANDSTRRLESLETHPMFNSRIFRAERFSVSLGKQNRADDDRDVEGHAFPVEKHDRRAGRPKRIE